MGSDRCFLFPPIRPSLIRLFPLKDIGKLSIVNGSIQNFEVFLFVWVYLTDVTLQVTSNPTYLIHFSSFVDPLVVRNAISMNLKARFLKKTADVIIVASAEISSDAIVRHEGHHLFFADYLKFNKTPGYLYCVTTSKSLPIGASGSLTLNVHSEI